MDLSVEILVAKDIKKKCVDICDLTFYFSYCYYLYHIKQYILVVSWAINVKPKMLQSIHKYIREDGLMYCFDDIH